MGKKSGSFLSLLTGIALGAAAIFFSKAENRDKTKKFSKRNSEKAKVEVNKAATKAKVVTKKVTSKGKKIKSKIKSDVKEIKKIAAAKK